MQRIAQPWLAYEMTDSPFLLSIVGVAQTAPVFVLCLFSGVIVDRFPKKLILLITQSVAFVVTLVMAVLIWADVIQYWHIVAGALILGITNSIDMPARQSFYIELVEKELLVNAIALCSSAFNIARIIGPLIAGLIMVYTTTGICFFANALSYALMFICLLMIHPRPVHRKKNKQRETMFSQIYAGLQHIRENQILSVTMLGVGIVGIFAFNFTVLLPVLVKTIFHADARNFSYLMSFMGVGSFCGALIVASTGKDGPKAYTQTVIPFLLGCTLFFTGMLNHMYLLCGIMMISGLLTVLFSSSANSMVQLHLSEEFRGRVMSIYILVFNGASAIGNFVAGVVMAHYDAQVAYMICGGAVVVLMAGVQLLRRRIFSPVQWIKTGQK
ncbi:enterobactin exporter EntS [Vibrio aerogenes CECT 7868]|uniref:Enterobactin exporter EntS n=2 Tax=Vibrio aerogenes TaxID=92172 RepID=A0A1M5ZR76_9VIBR|nr:enterobactin exporter EntS [Vibrio aerogenes CECT 7868]